MSLASVLLAAFLGGHESAAVCVAPPPPCYAWESSTDVFVGRVTAASHSGTHIVSFDVEEVFKGSLKAGQPATLPFEASGAEDMLFRPNRVYVVYTALSKNGRYQSACTRTFDAEPNDRKARRAIDAEAKLLRRCHDPRERTPKNFAVRLEFGVCTTDVIDTAARRYTRDTGQGKKSATVALSAQELLDLANEVADTAFFEWPRRIESRHANPDGTITQVFPSARYRLEVRGDGRRHLVEFEDHQNWNGEPENSMRRLVNSIIHLYRQRPEVKRLPDIAVGCL
jgi:hypothetical protein